MANQYAHQGFPKWKYHQTQEPRLVNTALDEEALGEGWANSPAGPFRKATDKPEKK